MTRLGFAKLFVDDLDAMATFISDAFDAREVGRMTIDDLDEVLLALDGGAPQIVLMRRHKPQPLQTGTMHGPVGLLVDNCDRTADACVTAGGKQLMAPTTLAQAGIRVAFLASPEGHEFEIVAEVGNEELEK